MPLHPRKEALHEPAPLVAAQMAPILRPFLDAVRAVRRNHLKAVAAQLLVQFVAIVSAVTNQIIRRHRAVFTQRIGQVGEYAAQYFACAPLLKASMHRLTVGVALRQQVPLGTGGENPKRRVEHFARRYRLASRPILRNSFLRKVLPDSIPLLEWSANESQSLILGFFFTVMHDFEIGIERRFVPKAKDINEDIAWAQINEDVLGSLERPRPLFWVIFLASVALFMYGVFCEIYQYKTGLGVTGQNNPQVWGLYIATFIFWIGMSHSGTLLSAILHLMHADWRKSTYRPSPEAMTTLFSPMTCFRTLRPSTPWQDMAILLRGGVSERTLGVAKFLFSPGLGCNGNRHLSHVVGDLFVLWHDPGSGHLPGQSDLPGVSSNGFSLGLGTDRQWANFRVTYLTIACLLIPLAVSVHSIVATDFAVSLQPGWHTTSFPPYFVAGALYSGCAAIITLFIILRYTFRFEQ